MNTLIPEPPHTIARVMVHAEVLVEYAEEMDLGASAPGDLVAALTALENLAVSIPRITAAVVAAREAALSA